MDYQKKIRSESKSIKIKIGLITFFVSIFGYLGYLSTISFVDVAMDYDILIFIYSWIGIFLAIYIVVSWKGITGTIFSPYTIFMLFFFLFNFGQSLMWAFGIHSPTEIGKIPMYSGFGTPSESDILKVQSIVIISILMFHLGATLSYKKTIKVSLQFAGDKASNSNKYENSLVLTSIFYSCLFIGIIVIPVQLYFVYSDFQVAMTYGYKSLYYSEHAKTNASFLGLLTRMFFPCLVGLLIGSRYNKKVKLIVYSIFAIYLVLNLLSGDRGSWIYKVIILVWLSHTCYKPINFKIAFKYLFVSIIGLYVTYSIVSVRDIGLDNLTISTLLSSFSLKNSILTKPFFEMGGSMKPTIILQKYGWDIWPYTNTYLLAVLGMVTNKLIYSMDLPFALISSWFSQDYLGLNWGAGFSIVAEALLNFGPIFSPIVMILLGYIISSLLYVDKRMSYRKYPLKILFIVTTLHVILPVTRSYFHLLLKDWFYSFIPLLIIIIICKNHLVKKSI